MPDPRQTRLQVISTTFAMRTLPILALTLLFPLHAIAYVTPEDMLEGSDYEETETNVTVTDLEEEEIAEDTIDDLHGSAPSLSADEARDERILERIERTRLENQGSQGEVVLHGSAPEPLHGGAPLAPTGTGTVVLLLSSAAAIGFTLRKALRM